jgi:cAMP-dependent protein kinase regulator
MNLADALIAKNYEKGSFIIRQGDSADGMYFIEDGTVAITVETQDGPKEVKN